MPPRRPRGYVGTNHQTIGSDIQAVLFALNFPRNVLGSDMVSRIEGLDPNGWYPVAMLLEVMETLHQRLGSSGLQKLGRSMFKNSHQQRVKPQLKSARDVIHGIDAMYRHANRGDEIGGWRVEEFGPGRAVLEKTTPHHCAMDEGILVQAISMFGVTARIERPECFRKGAELCRYVITSDVVDHRWDHTLAA